MGNVVTIPTFGYITLTEAVNNMQSVPSFIRNTLFKRELEYATRDILLDIIVGNKKIAPFVKRGNPSKRLSNTGVKSQTVTPPSIRLSKFLTPTDLSIRAAGDSIFVPGGQGGDPLTEARKKKYAIEQKDLKDVIDRTIEFMCARALSGSYTITQDDLEFTIDFGMPAANKPVLESGSLWTVANKSNSTPLKNLRAWKLIANKASGKIPTMLISNSTTYEGVLASDEVVKYLDKKNIDLGKIETEDAIVEMGAQKVAKLDGITHYTYDATYTDASGVEQKLIPDGYVALVSPSADNRLHFAAIEEVVTTVSKYFSKDKLEDDPAGVSLIVESDPLPATHQPESQIWAKVA